MANSVVARKITITTAWQALSSASEIASVTITAPTTNSGNVILRGDNGTDEVPLEPGEWHVLPSVDLAQIEVKGTADDVLTVIGGTW